MTGSFREQLLILISTPVYILIIGLELLIKPSSASQVIQLERYGKQYIPDVAECSD